MEILLDDKPCDLAAETVGEAIHAGAALAAGDGRIVVGVDVDGTAWTEADLESPERSAAGAGVVRLTTAEPAPLVAQTFEKAAEALAEADALQREAAKLLQSDQHAISMDKLGAAMATWLSVQNAITMGAEACGLELDTITVGGSSIGGHIAGLTERLEVIRDALENDDHIALADILLYEFPDVVETWQEILAALRTRLGSNA